MVYQLTGGAIQDIIGGKSVDKPVLQIITSKKICGASNADRYRLLVSDGQLSYSHVMLATQLNGMMESGDMENMSVFRADKYLCNTIQGDRKVVILLDLTVIAKGTQVGEKLGNPLQYKVGQDQNQNTLPSQQTTSLAIKKENLPSSSFGDSSSKQISRPANTYGKFGGNVTVSPVNGFGKTSPFERMGSSQIHSIASLTPYQNRWRIRVRVTGKSSIRTWSNSRGEGKLFSMNLLDESGEIRCTGFNDTVDKFYELIELNKVYYISRANLKTANKQYSSVQNDYEMTLTSDTIIEICAEDSNIPMIQFDFRKLNELDKIAANSIIDAIGIVNHSGDITTVTGRQSNKEITKREVQIVDQTGMAVQLTLWATEAEKFEGAGYPVLAVKGAKLSDFGGRSLSVLNSSQIFLNPDIREAHLLRGWFDRDGHQQEFQAFQSNAGSTHSNWKTFSQVKAENLGQGDKADYFTTKGTVIFTKKENCMYKACPTDQCNKKLIDQGNGLFRCEKCNQEFSNYKWRMILSVNIADFSDNNWVTFFQDSAQVVLDKPADELGNLKMTNESAFDQVFQEAVFKSYNFKLRAKVETYNDESRLKTICMSATPIDWREHGCRLLSEINKLTAV